MYRSCLRPLKTFLFKKTILTLNQSRNIHSIAKKYDQHLHTFNINHKFPRFLCSIKTPNIETAEDDPLNLKVDIKKITNNDPVLEKKLRLIMLEVDVLRQDGHNVPDLTIIREIDWKELLSKGSQSGRRKYLTFLFKNQKTRENEKMKKEKAKQEYLAQKQNEPKVEVENGHIQYGLGNNTIFYRVYDTAINAQANQKLIQAMQFSQKLVIDCSYDEHMNRREQLNTAKQLMLVFAENRNHPEPFDVHFCNVNRDTETIRALARYVPPIFDDSFPLHIHQESYLNIFPKDKLVYLTPHCKDDLVEYDHDAVYIIGAMVDKTNNEPISLAKAKKEDLQMKRFPLDRYLEWGSGSGKSLTLNQVLAILLDMRKTGDWKYALRHVPRRKIIEPGHYINKNDRLNSPFDKDKSRFVNRETNPLETYSTSQYIKAWNKTVKKPQEKLNVNRSSSKIALNIFDK